MPVDRGPEVCSDGQIPRLIIPESRTDTLVEAINYLLSREGSGGLSLRSIARESRVSTSSILHHFESRDHLLRVAAHRTGRARLADVQTRSAVEGVAAFLPHDDDPEDLITARAWRAWTELGRCDAGIGRVVGEHRDREHLLLARILDVPLRAEGLASVAALVDGLLLAMCAPTSPPSPAVGRRLLLDHLAGKPLLGAA